MAAINPAAQGTSAWIDPSTSTYHAVNGVIPNTNPNVRTYHFDGSDGDSITNADTWTITGWPSTLAAPEVDVLETDATSANAGAAVSGTTLVEEDRVIGDGFAQQFLVGITVGPRAFVPTSAEDPLASGN